MTTLDAVAAEVRSLADRLDGLASRFDARADAVQELQVTIARIEERQIARYEAEAAHRVAMAPLPERLARVEEAAEANARAIEGLDGRGWDRWILAGRGLAEVLIGPDGFLRSKPGVAVLVLVAVAFGTVTLDQIVSAYTSLWPVLVPVSTPP